MFTVNCILYWKTKKWKKRPGIANFFLFTQLPFDKPKAYQEVVYSHNIEMKWSKEYNLGYHILHIYDKLVIKTLFRLFLSFQTNITIFTTNKCEKCPSSIRSWDSNPQPSEHESPPITTTQGLPHLLLGLLWLRNHTGIFSTNLSTTNWAAQPSWIIAPITIAISLSISNCSAWCKCMWMGKLTSF